MEYSMVYSGRELLSARNRTQELPSHGQKSAFPSGSWLEGKQLDSRRDTYHDMLAEPRLARRDQLAVGVWLDTSNLVHITKVAGSFWHYMGVEADIGKCLYPEEAIYLMETGEMEVVYGDIPLSLQGAMRIMLPNSPLLDQYLVYAHLSRTGCKVIRHQAHLRFTRYEKQIRIDQYQTKRKRKREKIKLSDKNKNEDNTEFSQVKAIDEELDEFYAMLGTSAAVEEDNKIKEDKKTQEISVAKKIKFEEVLIDIDNEFENNRAKLLDIFPQMVGKDSIIFKVPSADLIPVVPVKSEYEINLRALNYYSKYVDETEDDGWNKGGNRRSDRGMMKWGRGNRGRGNNKGRNDRNQSNNSKDLNRHQQTDRDNYSNRRGNRTREDYESNHNFRNSKDYRSYNRGESGGQNRNIREENWEGNNKKERRLDSWEFSRREDYRENEKRNERRHDEKDFENRDHREWNRHQQGDRSNYSESLREDYRENEKRTERRHDEKDFENRDHMEWNRHQQGDRSNYSERIGDITLEDYESKSKYSDRYDNKSHYQEEKGSKFENRGEEKWESKYRTDSFEYSRRVGCMENDKRTEWGYDEKVFENRDHWDRHKRNDREHYKDEHDRRWDDTNDDAKDEINKSEIRKYKDEHDKQLDEYWTSLAKGNVFKNTSTENEELDIPNREVVESKESVIDYNIKPEWKKARRERKRPQRDSYPKTLIRVDPNKVRSWKDYKKLLKETGEESLLQSGPNGALWRRGTRPLIKPSMASNQSSILSLINLQKTEEAEEKPKVNIYNPLVLNYDVYLPSTPYKKSCPSIPDKRITVMRECDIPSLTQISEVTSRFEDGVSVICGVVVAGEVRTYTLAPVDLPNPADLIAD